MKKKLLYTRKEAAYYLSFTEGKLIELTYPRGTIVSIPLGKREYYCRQELERFVNDLYKERQEEILKHKKERTRAKGNSQ